MSLEVNQAEPAAPEVSVQTGTPPRASVVGVLRRGRAGWTRALQILTGLAVLRWLGTLASSLLGYRHEVTLKLEPASLDVEGERRLLGISLGRSRRVIPLSTVKHAGLSAESGTWALLAGAAVVVFSAVVAGVLLLWGIRGRQPSWVVLALCVLGAGLLLDAVAYLWVRRMARQARVTFEIVTGHERFRVCGAAERGAVEILDRLATRRA